MIIPPFGTVVAGQVAGKAAVLRARLHREGVQQTLREAVDRIGPRHRIANRWHYDLKWEWDADVMRGWLNGEVPDVSIVRKPGHG